MTHFFFLLIFAVCTLPAIALAAPRTFAELSAQLVGILNAGAGLLVAAAIAAYFYRIAQNMTSLTDKPKGETLRQFYFWGIFAIFIMVSVWGILALFQNSLFGGNPGAMRELHVLWS